MEHAEGGREGRAGVGGVDGGEGEREARGWGRAALPRSCAQHFNRFHLRACERASERAEPWKERKSERWEGGWVGRIERQTEAMRARVGVTRSPVWSESESERVKETVRTS